LSNVLLLSAGRRVELAQAIKSDLVARFPDGKLVAADMRPRLSAACQVADIAVTVPRATDPTYEAALLAICREQRVALVIPTIDTELLVLARLRERFAADGITVIVSEESVVRRCRDKRLTAQLFQELDIDTPKILARDALEFPCFAKPFDGSSSIGATRVESRAMLSESMLSDERTMFMELVDPASAEYTVDIYYDRNGALQCCVPRERIETRAGEVSKGITRRNEVYEYLLPRLRRMHGARGCLTLQLFFNHNSGRFAALEINPRFGGGFPLSYSAGACYPGWLVDEFLLGGRVAFYDGWERDLLMLRYDAKVLVRG
jgi:carbamoyl-phosphate synthase large subunit